MSKEVKATSVTEYRKDKTKLITLSSGVVFEIRKMSVPLMMEMTSILGIQVPKGTPLENVKEMMDEQVNDKEFTTNVIKAVNHVVPPCVVTPRIDPTGKDPDALSVEEVAPGDLFEAFMEITDFSGISKLGETFRAKFRDQPAGKGSQ